MPESISDNKEKQPPKMVVVTNTKVSETEKSNRMDEIRSDEVQEILSHVPTWTIRWGITLIFFLIVMLLSLSWFVKYPDIISGSMILTTENAPIRLVSKTAGNITQISVHEGAMISAGDVISVVENSVSKEEILWLQNFSQEIEQLLIDSSFILSVLNSDFAFGELQSGYNNLSKACFDYQKLQLSTFEQVRMDALSAKIKNYTKLKAITKRQIRITKSELKNVKYVYDENLKLFNKGTISKMELYREESKYRQKQMELENLNKSIAEQQINMGNLEQELRGLQFNYSDKITTLKKEIKLYLNSVQSGLENWELTYRLTSPISGKLIYLSDWKNNQFITTNTPLFAIIPNNQDYVVNVQIPTSGYGKVKIGQQVRIRLNGFPAVEYGYLTGDIKSLGEISTNGIYLAKVNLPNGLLTSYNIEIEFTPEMEGSAEIITDDLRVLERLFIQFNKLAERKNKFIESQKESDKNNN